jgi:hypothetical protein
MHPSRLLVLLMLMLLMFGFSPRSGAAQSKVVGNGAPESCTQGVLEAVLNGGGTITFNCGGAATIVIGSRISITAAETIIDGGGAITLQGANSRMFLHESDQVQSRLTLRNITLQGGLARGEGVAANGAVVESNDRSAMQDKPPILTLDNATITGNRTETTHVPGSLQAYDFGGAIYARAALVIVRASSFTNNASANGSGGAIHILQSGLSISDSVFRNNSAIGARPEDSLGGAIYIDGLGGPEGRFVVERSTFEGNQAYNSGGAIYVNMYENTTGATIRRSSFRNNAVVGGTRAQGGAIGGGGTGNGDRGNPSITISESLFAANTVRRTAGAGGNEREDGSGGALAFPQRARIAISNSTFVGNRAAGTGGNANGGALYVVNNSDPFTIESSTFADNHAGWVGGAISTRPIGEAPGGSVRNTLFVNNTADNGPNDWNIQQHCSSELAHDGRSLQFPPRLTGGNFWNDVTCFAGKSAPNQTSDPQFRDPQLQPLADNGGQTLTMAINRESLAFNAGEDCPPIDQRGVARPQGDACDLGAYELVLGLSAAPSLLAVAGVTRDVTIFGFGFTPDSIAQVNGTARATVFIDEGVLRVALLPTDVAVPAELTLSIRGPGSNLGTTTVRVVAAVNLVYVPLLRR